MWSKKHIYKEFDIESLNKMNKVKKYEIILDSFILKEDKSNIFLNDLKLLCSKFIKSNNYNSYLETTKDLFLSSNFDKTLNISFLKMILIMFVSVLTITISKGNEEEFKKWIREFKNFIEFIIISFEMFFIGYFNAKMYTLKLKD